MFPNWAYYPTMTKPEEGILRTASSKIKGKSCYKCDAFRVCSGVDVRYAMQLGLGDLNPIQKGMNTMSDYDLKAAEDAGFKILTGRKIDYSNDEFARGYLHWGLHPPKEIENETMFALEKMGLPRGKNILDIGCGNGVSSIKMAELGYNVTALDISPVFIEAGKKIEKEREFSQTAGNIKWVCSDYFDYQDEPYDAAILLDSGLDVANDRFIGKLREHLKPGGHFFLRYKQGFNGTTNWPWHKWNYDNKQATFNLERHTIDRLAGVILDEWISINFIEKEIIIHDMSTPMVPISRFIEVMAAAGFALIGAWGDLKGSPVTENSRIYAQFVRLVEAQ